MKGPGMQLRLSVDPPQQTRPRPLHVLGSLSSLEICSGAGGQALGLEQAGFQHKALVEVERWPCETLRQNRPSWPVFEQDLRTFDAKPYLGQIDLFAGGVPCPPFSIAGLRRGHLDERDLFPMALRLIRRSEPRAVMLENVKGLLAPEFRDYRARLDRDLSDLGYVPDWQLLNASDFGVPQLRPRAVLVAFRTDVPNSFAWPVHTGAPALPVGTVLRREMAANGWPHADEWAQKANAIAPTLVGGSRLHGGPDLGPTRAREAWARLGVDGRSLADEPPAPDFVGMPRLTVKMAAMLQGFPDDWVMVGRKTAAYRQVGNAFPPPVAAAVASSIYDVLAMANTRVDGVHP